MVGALAIEGRRGKGQGGQQRASPLNETDDRGGHDGQEKERWSGVELKGEKKKKESEKDTETCREGV